MEDAHCEVFQLASGSRSSVKGQDVIFLLGQSHGVVDIILWNTCQVHSKNHRVFISKGIQNWWAFKIAAHSAVDMLLFIGSWLKGSLDPCLCPAQAEWHKCLINTFCPHLINTNSLHRTRQAGASGFPFPQGQDKSEARQKNQSYQEELKRQIEEQKRKKEKEKAEREAWVLAT